MSAKDKGTPGLQMNLAGIDFFASARDVLNGRMRELTEKYSGVGKTINHALVGQARDAIAMVNLGYASASEAWNPMEDARDIVLLDHVLAMDRNESGAASSLHDFLSNELHRNTLTITAAHLLAAMHRALARGLPAEEAMLTKPPSGRPSKAERDRAVIRYMQGEEKMRELMAAAGKPDECRSKAESYKEAARIFSLSVKTIRNICAGI